MAKPDPNPWRHTSGQRVADPRAADSPAGDYTFKPRHGFSDHGERYVSTRWPDWCHRCRAEGADRG